MTVFVGDILNATAAAVTSDPASTRTWQWLRSGSALSGFTGTSYRVLTGDAGSTLAVRQTETNFMGAASATSDPTATVGTWTPSTLFALSEPGVWYDTDDYTAMFQDSVGTTPVTGAGQTVGLLLDKSQGLVLGPELVVNGDFATDTGWTKGAGVTISGGKANFSAASGYVLYRASVSGISVGSFYEVTFTVSDYVSGSIRPYLGATPTFGASVSANGTYTARFGPTAGAEIGFNSASAFTGSIDNFSIKAVTGNHATQATLASRPTTVIRPMDAERRNLLTRTEEFNDAVWTKQGATPTTNAVVAPDGSMTADKLTETATSAVHRAYYTLTVVNSTPHTTSVYAKAGERNWVSLAGTTNNRAWFNLATGTIGTVNATLTAAIQSVGDGWYRCSVTQTTGVVTGYLDIAVSSGDNIYSYLGDGTSGVYVWGAQLEQASSATPYQRVVTTYEWYDPAVPSYRALQFDGVANFMVTPTITPGTDKAQVFAGVRNLTASSVGVIAELSASAATNNGALILAARETVSNYFLGSRGTVNADVRSPASYPAPITNTLTGIGDIAGDVASLRVNGTQVAQTLTDQGTGNYLAYPIYIGRRAGTSLPFNGILTSLVVRFGTNLSSSVINRAEYYVSEKTGFDLAKFTAPEIYARSGEMVFDRFNATIERRAV